MNLLGFFMGQFVVVIICWSYFTPPGENPIEYIRSNYKRHVGDASLSFFVAVLWKLGWIDAIGTKFGLGDLAGHLPQTGTTALAGFGVGGVCSAIAWKLHGKFVQLRNEEQATPAEKPPAP